MEEGEKLKSIIERFHYSNRQKGMKNLFSARLDLLFVFTLDINPGWELTEKKEAELGDAIEAFDYLIYSFLRPT